MLDFPTLDRFIEEIRTHQYDVIGISSIIPNIYKVKKMCELIRQYQPNAKIVIGGHIANVPDLGERIDADHIVRGEGVRWFRRFLGEDENRPLRHPMITSGFGTRNVGRHAQGQAAATWPPRSSRRSAARWAATSAPPRPCSAARASRSTSTRPATNCSTSCASSNASMGVRSFFMMDENFLFHRKRALRLLELMEEHDKSWSLYVFSSANVLRSYTIDQLIRLGISWVWMGIEGRNSQYTKLDGIDTFELVRELQSNGIRVLGSTIIGLENHTPENIDEAIDYAARHDTDFHQFMLYTPIPGTPLHAELTAKGADEGRERVSPERHPRPVDLQLPPSAHQRRADGRVHASGVRPRFRGQRAEHGADRPHDAGRLAAAQEPSRSPRPRPLRLGSPRVGHHVLGASSARRSSTTATIRRCTPRCRRCCGNCTPSSAGSRGWLRPFGGRWVLRQIRKEEKRLAAGFSYEPPTFYERNEAVTDRPDVPLCRYATPPAMPAAPAQPLVVTLSPQERELVGA